MKITELKKNKNNDRISVYVDDKFELAVTVDSVLENGLRVDREITEEEIEKLKIRDRKEKALASAVRTLNYGRKTEKELREKLRSKGFDADSVDFAIGKCLQYSFLNDDTLAEDYIHQHQRMNGWGPARIRQELRQKGYTEEYISNALLDHYGDEEHWACHAARSKACQLAAASTTNKASRLKLASFLSGRGFSREIATGVAEQFFPEAEDHLSSLEADDLLEIVQDKYRRLSPRAQNTWKLRSKITAALVRKGYRTEDILDALDVVEQKYPMLAGDEEAEPEESLSLENVSV